MSNFSFKGAYRLISFRGIDLFIFRIAIWRDTISRDTGARVFCALGEPVALRPLRPTNYNINLHKENHYGPTVVSILCSHTESIHVYIAISKLYFPCFRFGKYKTGSISSIFRAILSCIKLFAHSSYTDTGTNAVAIYIYVDSQL